MGSRIQLLLGILLASLLTGAAHAVPMNLSYSGTVTASSGPGVPLVGETFTGMLTYEDSTPDGDPGDPTHATYLAAVLSHSVVFSGGTSETQTVLGNGEVWNDFAFAFDRWRMESSSGTAVWAFDLIDFGQDALASDALAPPSLPLFDTPRLFFSAAGENAEGVVTSSSILAAPEPSTSLLVGAGFVALGLRGRRRTARR